MSPIEGPKNESGIYEGDLETAAPGGTYGQLDAAQVQSFVRKPRFAFPRCCLQRADDGCVACSQHSHREIVDQARGRRRDAERDLAFASSIKAAAEHFGIKNEGNMSWRQARLPVPARGRTTDVRGRVR